MTKPGMRQIDKALLSLLLSALLTCAPTLSLMHKHVGQVHTMTRHAGSMLMSESTPGVKYNMSSSTASRTAAAPAGLFEHCISQPSTCHLQAQAFTNQ